MKTNIIVRFSLQGRQIPGSGPASQANQPRAANYKYTTNMRNPPAQNAPMVAQPAPVQAVHVKGKSIITTLNFQLLLTKSI